ncbi:hydroxypyruvate reductase [Actibacterium atlanticum]|uniref:Hydroxypyruvate reductase n=1 Tax=Actibacterium atlanticum TaxID=1461693 RepID=A0A058ZMS1_9RHOB|nr:glycerate kinase [Actibacterium atlanticum]KCV82828.1 hydroxypyruvate reductase [Actibacterium atlanticum]
MTLDAPSVFLRGLFDTAVDVADPMNCVPDALPERPAGRVVVIGAGKASARMAEAVEAAWGPQDGFVITRYGYARPTQQIEIVEAAHPVPDAAGAKATKHLSRLVSELGEDDFVLALISGGGSALLVQPAADITLDEKQALTQDLLASGAPIGDINGIRKELSAVKGGRLAATAYPARMLTLMISDVPGDDPSDIASGPTVAHAGDAQRALDCLKHWKVTPSDRIRAYLEAGGDPVAPGDVRLSRVENVVVAAPSQSLAAARDQAEAAGCSVRILGDALEGEARDAAAEQATLAMQVRDALKPGDQPVVLLSGGEFTVTRNGDGVGGPNAEFSLALALALNGAAGIHAIACDTDGVDGAAEVAGAIIGPDTLARAAAKGVDATDALRRNDSHTFFAKMGDQVVPGPTLTNVNDFRAILVLPPA